MPRVPAAAFTGTNYFRCLRDSHVAWARQAKLTVPPDELLKISYDNFDCCFTSEASVVKSGGVSGEDGEELCADVDIDLSSRYSTSTSPRSEQTHPAPTQRQLHTSFVDRVVEDHLSEERCINPVVEDQHLPHQQSPHPQISHQHISHQHISQQQTPHPHIPHQHPPDYQILHQRLPHQQLPYHQAPRHATLHHPLSLQPFSHQQLPRQQLSHQQLPRQQFSYQPSPDHPALHHQTPHQRFLHQQRTRLQYSRQQPPNQQQFTSNQHPPRHQHLLRHQHLQRHKLFTHQQLSHQHPPPEDQHEPISDPFMQIDDSIDWDEENFEFDEAPASIRSSHFTKSCYRPQLELALVPNNAQHGRIEGERGRGSTSSARNTRSAGWPCDWAGSLVAARRHETPILAVVPLTVTHPPCSENKNNNNQQEVTHLPFSENKNNDNQQIDTQLPCVEDISNNNQQLDTQLPCVEDISNNNQQLDTQLPCVEDISNNNQQLDTQFLCVEDISNNNQLVDTQLSCTGENSNNNQQLDTLLPCVEDNSNNNQQLDTQLPCVEDNSNNNQQLDTQFLCVEDISNNNQQLDTQFPCVEDNSNNNQQLDTQLPCVEDISNNNQQLDTQFMCVEDISNNNQQIDTQFPCVEDNSNNNQQLDTQLSCVEDNSNNNQQLDTQLPCVEDNSNNNQKLDTQFPCVEDNSNNNQKLDTQFPCVEHNSNNNQQLDTQLSCVEDISNNNQQLDTQFMCVEDISNNNQQLDTQFPCVEDISNNNQQLDTQFPCVEDISNNNQQLDTQLPCVEDISNNNQQLDTQLPCVEDISNNNQQLHTQFPCVEDISNNNQQLDTQFLCVEDNNNNNQQIDARLPCVEGNNNKHQMVTRLNSTKDVEKSVPQIVRKTSVPSVDQQTTEDNKNTLTPFKNQHTLHVNDQVIAEDLMSQQKTNEDKQDPFDIAVKPQELNPMYDYDRLNYEQQMNYSQVNMTDVFPVTSVRRQAQSASVSSSPRTVSSPTDIPTTVVSLTPVVTPPIFASLPPVVIQPVVVSSPTTVTHPDISHVTVLSPIVSFASDGSPCSAVTPLPTINRVESSALCVSPLSDATSDITSLTTISLPISAFNPPTIIPPLPDIPSSAPFTANAVVMENFARSLVGACVIATPVAENSTGVAVDSSDISFVDTLAVAGTTDNHTLDKTTDAGGTEASNTLKLTDNKSDCNSTADIVTDESCEVGNKSKQVLQSQPSGAINSTINNTALLEIASHLQYHPTQTSNAPSLDLHTGNVQPSTINKSLLAEASNQMAHSNSKQTPELIQSWPAARSIVAVDKTVVNCCTNENRPLLDSKVRQEKYSKSWLLSERSLSASKNNGVELFDRKESSATASETFSDNTVMSTVRKQPNTSVENFSSAPLQASQVESSERVQVFADVSQKLIVSGNEYVGLLEANQIQNSKNMNDSNHIEAVDKQPYSITVEEKIILTQATSSDHESGSEEKEETVESQDLFLELNPVPLVTPDVGDAPETIVDVNKSTSVKADVLVSEVSENIDFVKIYTPSINQCLSNIFTEKNDGMLPILKDASKSETNEVEKQQNNSVETSIKKSLNTSVQGTMVSSDKQEIELSSVVPGNSTRVPQQSASTELTSEHEIPINLYENIVDGISEKNSVSTSISRTGSDQPVSDINHPVIGETSEETQKVSEAVNFSQNISSKDSSNLSSETDAICPTINKRTMQENEEHLSQSSRNISRKNILENLAPSPVIVPSIECSGSHNDAPSKTDVTNAYIKLNKIPAHTENLGIFEENLLQTQTENHQLNKIAPLADKDVPQGLRYDSSRSDENPSGQSSSESLLPVSITSEKHKNIKSRSNTLQSLHDLKALQACKQQMLVITKPPEINTISSEKTPPRFLTSSENSEIYEVFRTGNHNVIKQTISSEHHDTCKGNRNQSNEAAINDDMISSKRQTSSESTQSQLCEVMGHMCHSSVNTAREKCLRDSSTQPDSKCSKMIGCSSNEIDDNNLNGEDDSTDKLHNNTPQLNIVQSMDPNTPSSDLDQSKQCNNNHPGMLYTSNKVNQPIYSESEPAKSEHGDVLYTQKDHKSELKQNNGGISRLSVTENKNALSSFTSNFRSDERDVDPIQSEGCSPIGSLIKHIPSSENTPSDFITSERDASYVELKHNNTHDYIIKQSDTTGNSKSARAAGRTTVFIGPECDESEEVYESCSVLRPETISFNNKQIETHHKVAERNVGGCRDTSDLPILSPRVILSEKQTSKQLSPRNYHKTNAISLLFSSPAQTFINNNERHGRHDVLCQPIQQVTSMVNEAQVENNLDYNLDQRAVTNMTENGRSNDTSSKLHRHRSIFSPDRNSESSLKLFSKQRTRSIFSPCTGIETPVSNAKETQHGVVQPESVFKKEQGNTNQETFKELNDRFSSKIFETDLPMNRSETCINKTNAASKETTYFSSLEKKPATKASEKTLSASARFMHRFLGIGSTKENKYGFNSSYKPLQSHQEDNLKNVSKKYENTHEFDSDINDRISHIMKRSFLNIGASGVSRNDKAAHASKAPHASNSKTSFHHSTNSSSGIQLQINANTYPPENTKEVSVIKMESGEDQRASNDFVEQFRRQVDKDIRSVVRKPPSKYLLSSNPTFTRRTVTTGARGKVKRAAALRNDFQQWKRMRPEPATRIIDQKSNLNRPNIGKKIDIEHEHHHKNILDPRIVGRCNPSHQVDSPLRVFEPNQTTSHCSESTNGSNFRVLPVHLTDEYFHFLSILRASGFELIRYLQLDHQMEFNDASVVFTREKLREISRSPSHNISLSERKFMRKQYKCTLALHGLLKSRDLLCRASASHVIAELIHYSRTHRQMLKDCLDDTLAELQASITALSTSNSNTTASDTSITNTNSHCGTNSDTSVSTSHWSTSSTHPCVRAAMKQLVQSVRHGERADSGKMEKFLFVAENDSRSLLEELEHCLKMFGQMSYAVITASDPPIQILSILQRSDVILLRCDLTEIPNNWPLHQFSMAISLPQSAISPPADISSQPVYVRQCLQQHVQVLVLHLQLTTVEPELAVVMEAQTNDGVNVSEKRPSAGVITCQVSPSISAVVVSEKRPGTGAITCQVAPSISAVVVATCIESVKQWNLHDLQQHGIRLVLLQPSNKSMDGACIPTRVSPELFLSANTCVLLRKPNPTVTSLIYRDVIAVRHYVSLCWLLIVGEQTDLRFFSHLKSLLSSVNGDGQFVVRLLHIQTESHLIEVIADIVRNTDESECWRHIHSWTGVLDPDPQRLVQQAGVNPVVAHLLYTFCDPSYITKTNQWQLDDLKAKLPMVADKSLQMIIDHFNGCQKKCISPAPAVSTSLLPTMTPRPPFPQTSTPIKHIPPAAASKHRLLPQYTPHHFLPVDTTRQFPPQAASQHFLPPQATPQQLLPLPATPYKHCLPVASRMLPSTSSRPHQIVPGANTSQQLLSLTTPAQQLPAAAAAVSDQLRQEGSDCGGILTATTAEEVMRDVTGDNEFPWQPQPEYAYQMEDSPPIDLSPE